MSESGKAVFLSYASQDAAAAKRICEALRAAGIEVWFDQNELVGGDAWDAKIRRQIADCALFVPVISANTQARREGYFRLEWKLAAQRTHMIADDTPFLLPVVIDETRDAEARVPAEFKSVQWTRLSGGETAAPFCARVLKLLTASDRGEPPTAGATPTAPAATPARRRPAWIGYGWAAVGIVVALVYAVRPMWQSKREPSATPRTAAVAAEPASEAQRLVAKAREILDQGDELNRENYALAEELLKRAEAADVTEASAWGLHAWLSADLYRYGLDRTESRLAQIQAQASRAVSLAPDSLDAQLAMLRSQTATRGAPEEIARRQAELADKFPDDPRVYRLFGLSHAKDSVTFKMLTRGLERWPNDSRLQGDLLNSLILGGRYPEASGLAERFTGGRTGARVLAVQVFLQLWWQGDAAAAAASVARWPSWFLLEDRGAAMAAITALMNRTPENALELLRRFPRDYVRDSFYTGPRSALVALASEAAGQRESAEAEWRVVLQVCDRELATTPNEGAALHWKAWALARLGQRAEAQQILRVLVQRRVAIEGSAQVTGGLAGLALVLGDPDEALRELGRLGSYDPQRTRPPSRALFDLNPLFDPIRRDPRFQTLRDAAPAPAAAAAPAPSEKSVAVLAFANLSSDKEQEYFSDGISEELLNVLAKVPGLKVSARTSAFFFKGRNTPIPEIARQLGVAYVVEGSVRKAGDKVRITAQLIKAADGFRVWSDTFTRDVKDIFAVQDEIASVVARNLSLQLGVTARPAHQASAEAIALLTEGRHYWALRTTDGFARAGELYRQAIQLDPEWPRAYAALANLQVIEASFRSGDGEDMAALFAEAERNALRALSLDPDLADAYAALGKLATDRTQWSQSAEYLAKALALDPNNVAAHDWHADYQLLQGRLDLALAGYRRALELDPLSPFVLFDNTWALLHLRRFSEMKPLIERASELTPGSRTRLAVRKAHVLLRLGWREESGAALRPALAPLAAGEDPAQISEAVWCLRELGWARELDQLTTSILSRPQPKFAKGVLLAAIGRAAEAHPYLELATPIMRQVLYFDPALDAVRDTPEFRRVLQKLGCEKEHATARATLARMLQEGSATP